MSLKYKKLTERLHLWSIFFSIQGFSKVFFEHADEERQHGLKFIEYLRLRGGDTTSDFLGNGKLEPILSKYVWNDGTEALRDALAMEKVVSANIKNMIDSCDNKNVNDYYSADWLTGTWYANVIYIFICMYIYIYI